MRPKIALSSAVLAVLTAAALFAGCGSTGSSSSAAITEQNYSSGVDGKMDYQVLSSADGLKATAASDSTAASDRKLVTNASLSIDAKDFDAAAAEILKQTQTLGGYISYSNTSGSAENSTRKASYTVRVPADRLNDFLSAASAVGTVTSQQQSTADITDDYVDSAAKLENLQAQEKRLNELMEKAATVDEILQIENEITDVRSQIDSLTGRLKLYDNQVAYASVSVSLAEATTATAAATSFGSRIEKALAGSAESFKNFLEGFVIVLIYFAPFIVIVLVAVLAVVLVHRNRRAKRSVPAAPDSAVPPAPDKPDVPQYNDHTKQTK